MATVYLADDLKHGRKVAVKIHGDFVRPARVRLLELWEIATGFFLLSEHCGARPSCNCWTSVSPAPRGLMVSLL